MGAQPSKPSQPSTLKMLRDNYHGVIDIILLHPTTPASDLANSNLESLVDRISPKYVPQYDGNGSGEIIGGCWHRVISYTPIQLGSNQESEARRLDEALMGDVAGRKRDVRHVVFVVFDSFGRDVVGCLLSNSQTTYIDHMCERRLNKELIIGLVGFNVDLNGRFHVAVSRGESDEKRIARATGWGSFRKLCDESRVLRKEIRCGDMPSKETDENEKPDGEEVVRLKRSLEKLVRLSGEEDEKQDPDIKEVKAAFLSMTAWYLKVCGIE
ncbi:hypothetical protein BGZ60DRAFT_413865 [Tricladium varicosporioides]|nr:hypothetical protein BGZ60DRAFT_413865 [Hymenoscyphus varicosporioides]